MPITIGGTEWASAQFARVDCVETEPPYRAEDYRLRKWGAISRCDVPFIDRQIETGTAHIIPATRPCLRGWSHCIMIGNRLIAVMKES